MVKQKILIPIFAILMLVVMVIFMAGGFKDKVEPKVANSQLNNVQTISVQPINYVDRIWIPGSLIAQQNTKVSSRILANIVELKVRAGDTVEAGDVIANLDNQDLKAQVGQIEAQVEAVSAQLTQASLQLTRNKALHQQGLISVNELDTTQSNYDQLKATKVSYEQQLEQAKVALTYSKIVAPIAGKVVDRLVEPGDLVNPGQAIVVLYNPTSIQVSSFIPESYAVSLQVGQQLQIELPALQHTINARINEIVPIADSAARSFEVKLDLTNNSSNVSNLMPGMYAKVAISEPSRSVIAIDKKYVQQFGQLTKVLVLENEQVNERFIRLGQSLENNLVIVVSGLSEGDKIVI